MPVMKVGPDSKGEIAARVKGIGKGVEVFIHTMAGLGFIVGYLEAARGGVDGGAGAAEDVEKGGVALQAEMQVFEAKAAADHKG